MILLYLPSKKKRTTKKEKFLEPVLLEDLNKGFSCQVFKMSSLSLGTVDILGCAVLCYQAVLCIIGCLASSLTSAHLSQLKTSPDVAKPLLGGRLTLVEKEQVELCGLCLL